MNHYNIFNHKLRYNNQGISSGWVFYNNFIWLLSIRKEFRKKIGDMLSRPPTNASIVIQQSPLVHASYVEQYTKDRDFKEVYDSLRHGYQN